MRGAVSLAQLAANVQAEPLPRLRVEKNGSNR